MIDPTVAYEDLFYSDYNDVRWTEPGETRVITWSSVDLGGQVFIPFGGTATVEASIQPYLAEIETAFALWDAALSSLNFVRTDEGNAADVTLGVTDLGSAGGNLAFWNASWTSNIINRATIRFDVNDIESIPVTTIALHEIGNVLGLGDIRPSLTYRSVQEDPIPEAFAGTTLWDDDLALIRRYYGEQQNAPVAEVLAGTTGDDLFAADPGADILVGSDGWDTLRLAGDIDHYALTVNSDGTVTLDDGGQGTSGVDELESVEVVEFGSANVWFPSGSITLTDLTGIATLSEDQIFTLVEMYVAYFDRAPDAIGLNYWGTRLADGMTYEEIAESFFVQPETRALYPPELSNEALVRAAYQNYLERAPEEAGLAYWTGELDAGFSRGKFMLALINGALDNVDPLAVQDVETIVAKAEIGLHYASIHGLTDVENAESAMRAYERGDAGSLVDAHNLTDQFAAAASGADAELTMALAGVVDDPSAQLV